MCAAFSNLITIFRKWTSPRPLICYLALLAKKLLVVHVIIATKSLSVNTIIIITLRLMHAAVSQDQVESPSAEILFSYLGSMFQIPTMA